MKLYDDTISEVRQLLKQYPRKGCLPEKSGWKDITDSSMILRSDMAYELGGEGMAAVGMSLVTDEEDLIKKDSIILIGPDLHEISKDTSFARIAIVKVKKETLGEGNRLYKAIRTLEYTRYHFYPEGFMMRVSASRGRECVRVGKAALKKGLSFKITGSRMIEAFKKNPAVENVMIVYITDPAFDYKKLQELGRAAEKITEAIDHMSKNAVMDCHVCSLKPVCDEVEGLRELHFHQGEEPDQK